MRDFQAGQLDRASLLARYTQSIATIEWALSMVPEGWAHRSPSGTRMTQEEDAWSVAMNLAHLTLYTERLPTGVLADLLKGGDGVSWFSPQEPSPVDPEAVELAAQPVAAIFQRLRTAHSREIDLAGQFSDEKWTAPQTRAWGGFGYGPRTWSPARVVAKSFQHVFEHGNSILRVALYAPRDLEPADVGRWGDTEKRR